MTTKITVDTHAGWPVKVIRVDDATGEWVGEPTVVPPNAQQEFYLWAGSDLLLHEVQPDGSRTVTSAPKVT
jgi:hypothetical protein